MEPFGSELWWILHHHLPFLVVRGLYPGLDQILPNMHASFKWLELIISNYQLLSPDSITAAYITGGIPPVVDSLETVYRKSYKSVMDHTEQYYKQFPMDIKRVKKIMKYLATNEVKTSNGSILTPRKFQQLGQRFGVSGGMELVHQLCLSAFVTIQGKEVLSSAFLHGVESAQDLIPPIYAILHEAIYCDGPNVASNWTASKLLNGEFKSAFGYSVEEYGSLEDDSSKIVYFTGNLSALSTLGYYAVIKRPG